MGLITYHRGLVLTERKCQYVVKYVHGIPYMRLIKTSSILNFVLYIISNILAAKITGEILINIYSLELFFVIHQNIKSHIHTKEIIE